MGEATRKANGRWVKGKSANPGGRRKDPGAEELRKMCRELTPDIIQRLADIVNEGEDRDAINAGRELLNRGYGRVREAPKEVGEEETANSMLAKLLAKK